MSKIVPDYLNGWKLVPDDNYEQVCSNELMVTTGTQGLSDQTIKDINRAFKALEILEEVTEECKYSFSAKFEYNGRKFKIRCIEEEDHA